jgi:formyl-CoA transferase
MLSAKDAEEVLEQAEVPCARLYDIADCATDPHFLARKAILPVNDPLIGPTLHPGPVIRLDGEEPEDAVRWTGPEAGAHTDFVLHTLLGLPRGQTT